jgi:ankyrin repeat protein
MVMVIQISPFSQPRYDDSSTEMNILQTIERVSVSDNNDVTHDTMPLPNDMMVSDTDPDRQQQGLALEQACCCGDVATFDTLWLRNTTTGHNNHENWHNLLMYAISYNQYEIVSRLLSTPGPAPTVGPGIHNTSSSMDVNAKDGVGDTALNLAIAALNWRETDTERETGESIIDLLLSCDNMDVNQMGAEQSSPLLTAVEGNRIGIVKKLQYHGGDRRQGAAAAASEPDTKLNVNAIAGAESKSGISALMAAAMKGNAKMIELLLEFDDIDVNLSNCDGKTALHFAAAANDDDDADDVTSESSDAIHSNAAAAVSLLIHHPAIKPDIKDKQGQTPLMCACAAGNEDAVQFIMQHEKVDINAGAGAGDSSCASSTPLVIAASCGYGSIVSLLLSHPRIDVNATSVGDNCTALIVSAANNHASIVDQLLQRAEISVNIRNATGNTALLASVKQQNESTAMSLLEHNCGINVNLRNHKKDAALLLATRYSMHDVVCAILNSGNCDVNITDSAGHTALIIATRTHNDLIVEKLIHHPNIMVNVPNMFMETALFVAVEQSQPSTIEILLQHPDLNVNCTNTAGRTPLMLAIIYGHTQIVKFLLQHPDIAIDMKDLNYGTALTFCLHTDRVQCMTLLLEHPDTVIHPTNTLALAIERKATSVIPLLLKHPSVEINTQGWGGQTALDIAVIMQRMDAVKLLLTCPGIEVNTPSRKGTTPLQCAVQCEQVGLVQQLLLHPSIDVNATGSSPDGNSPLHLAVLQPFSSGVLACLLENVEPHIELNPINASGQSPLFLALHQRNEDAVEYLLGIDGVDIFASATDPMLSGAPATITNKLVAAQNLRRMVVIYPPRSRQLWPTAMNGSVNAVLVTSFFESKLMDVQVLRCIRVFL